MLYGHNVRQRECLFDLTYEVLREIRLLDDYIVVTTVLLYSYIF